MRKTEGRAVRFSCTAILLRSGYPSFPPSHSFFLSSDIPDLHKKYFDPFYFDSDNFQLLSSSSIQKHRGLPSDIPTLHASLQKPFLHHHPLTSPPFQHLSTPS